MLDIHALMGRLAKKRPIFHSEADFQHALAWEIHKTTSGCEIRLEYPVPEVEETMALDIWIPTEKIAIELKYPTKWWQTTVAGELFSLKEHGAQPPTRYRYFQDIQRLEKEVIDRRAQQGFAVLLTNQPDYWKGSPRENETNDTAFRIHEGWKVSAGELAWVDPRRGAAKGKEESIHLKNSYHLEWNDYSFPITESDDKIQVSEEIHKKILQLEEKFSRFRYLAVHVRDL